MVLFQNIINYFSFNIAFVNSSYINLKDYDKVEQLRIFKLYQHTSKVRFYPDPDINVDESSVLKFSKNYTLSELEKVSEFKIKSAFTQTVNPDKLKIGDYYGGGVVFFLDKSGKHGLVAAPIDQLRVAECDCDITTVTTSDSVGSGMTNTKSIVKQCGAKDNAAFVCSNLNLNGYDDWFLPSIKELELIYKNLYEKNLGFLFNNYENNSYRSSTREVCTGCTDIKGYDFYNKGVIYHQCDSRTCPTRRVRAIRKF